jgi:proteasome lid subunit RPN8/RPN11
MVAHCVAALLLLSVIHSDLAHDPTVRGALWKLLEDAHYGHAEMEEAMFIVRGTDGVLSFVRWHPTGAAHQAQWNAAVPQGTIAIAHTHPNTLPRPSTNDIRTAMQANLPVYVVTRTKITKTSGGETSVVLKGEWGGAT